MFLTFIPTPYSLARVTKNDLHLVAVAIHSDGVLEIHPFVRD